MGREWSQLSFTLKTLVFTAEKNCVLLTGYQRLGGDCCFCLGGGIRGLRVPPPLLPTCPNVAYVLLLLLLRGWLGLWWYEGCCHSSRIRRVCVHTWIRRYIYLLHTYGGDWGGWLHSDHRSVWRCTCWLGVQWNCTGSKGVRCFRNSRGSDSTGCYIWLAGTYSEIGASSCQSRRWLLLRLLLGYRLS